VPAVVIPWLLKQIVRRDFYDQKERLMGRHDRRSTMAAEINARLRYFSPAANSIAGTPIAVLLRIFE
jgi:hypothetical protein